MRAIRSILQNLILRTLPKATPEEDPNFLNESMKPTNTNSVVYAYAWRFLSVPENRD